MVVSFGIEINIDSELSEYIPRSESLALTVTK